MRLLPQKLLESASRRPDDCAVQQGPTVVSYAELARRASAVARWLNGAGVGAGDRVALLGEASADYVAAYYGTLLAGGAVIALNAAARADDLANWIMHGEASALILDGAHPEAENLLPRLAPNVRVLIRGGITPGAFYDDWATVMAGGGGPLVTVDAHSGQLAVLMYTSGTTGHPKAVMLSHANLAANTDSIVHYLHLTRQDSIVCVLPFYYSYGGSVLHTHLATGARIVLEPNLVYPHRVVETMVREAVTGFAGVPSTFALLTSRVQLDRYDLSSLRYITQAGGPMSPALIERVCAQVPGAQLFVMYGQTEASARLTYLPPLRLGDKSGSVGIAIPGVEIEVRADNGSRTSADTIGEVWARGDNVMLGYWRDAQATSTTVVDGWLRTGDTGRLDGEGFLYLEGRRSDIIKVGAHRVFPHDIEAIIEALTGVAEVAVVGVDDDILGQVIKACIVAEPDATLNDVTVKAHCRAHLPAYKIPKIVEFHGALPKTSTGKVRRQLLATQSPGQSTP